MVEAVFFDFDGVILDSVDVKTQAFSEMFEHYGSEVQKAVVDYHLAHGGISRFRKFEYCYQYILNKKLTSDELTSLGETFKSKVLDGVLGSAFIPGVEEVLKSLSELRIPLFVVSGTPHDEVNEIVDKRNLRKYFLEVHGSPHSKKEILNYLIGCYGFKPEHCLFIGDALSDYDAASSVTMPFLGVINKNAPFPKGTNTCSRLDVKFLQLN